MGWRNAPLLAMVLREEVEAMFDVTALPYKERTDVPMTTKRRRGLAVALAMVALTCALLGCTSQEASTSESGDAAATTESAAKELRAGSTTYFFAESLDPASEWDSWYLCYYGIVETLFKVSDDLTAEPWLAESITDGGDGQTWTIAIRDGITFSNGNPVDAAAVKAAWERTYAENARGAETLAIDSMEADGQTLTVHTSAPVPGIENILCDPLLCVYDATDVDATKGTAATGPYVPVEFVAEDHAVLEPNKGYWDGEPKLDRVTLVSFTDDNALTMAMQNDEIDAVAMPSASALATLSGGDYEAFTRTTSRADMLRINMAHPVMQNDAVRTAVAYCIDRDGYAQVICQNSSQPCWGVYSPTLPFGGTEGLTVNVEKFDIEAAKQVLESAGITDADGDGVRELNGSPVELSLYACTNYERFVREADDLQSNLAQAGIKVNIMPVDYFIEDAETFDADDPDMVFNSYAMAPTGNAAYFATQNFATDASGNLGHYSNAQVDALIDELNATYDMDARDGLARQIAQIVLDDLPYIFFGNTDACVIADKGVSGLDASPSEYYFVTVDADVA